jgi:hypothetical protein
MRLLPCFVALLLSLTAARADTDPTRLFPAGKSPDDKRLTTVRTLNDKDFFLVVPPTRQAWEARRQAVRQRILVATGLWPMPPSTPLHPTIHGRIDRDGYSVEKVFFASHPGHYVCGNLYRPRIKDGKLPQGKLPAVLCPHGHWRNGRLHDAGDAEAKAQMKQKAERTYNGARYPLQARCAQLARLGCVVFFYDMVGYADSKAIPHSAFHDAQAELCLQNLMGLQTWNSIRALDFLLSLPEVDPRRIGVTGASGGGTQTFILAGIDDRPTAAFPAVMVSTQMQGGCVCENCSYLRLGTGNVEFAGLFAPKPLAMSAANDWTIDLERKGLPELKKLYKLYDADDRITARCWPEFGHNYNQHAREMMYNWFNKHLALGHKGRIVEQLFEPIPPRDLSVFDDKHPVPKDSVKSTKLRGYLTRISDSQIQALRPTDAKTLAEFRRVLGAALRVMIGSELPGKDGVEATRKAAGMLAGGVSYEQLLLKRKGSTEQVPALFVRGANFTGTVVVWVHPDGKASLLASGKLSPLARQILDGKAAILAPDALGTGELALPKGVQVNSGFAGYTFGYNPPLVSWRAHDVLTAVACTRARPGVKAVHLLGLGKAGPWVLLARALCGDAVSRTAADVNRFRFDKVSRTDDEMMLPGALKYGGLGMLASLAAPGELFVHNHRGCGMGDRGLKPAYKAAGAAEKLKTSGDRIADDKVIDWLLR